MGVGRIIECGRIAKFARKEENTMAKNEKTSKAVGTKASKLLRSIKTSKNVKGVAGSALTQRPDRKKKK